MDNGKEGAFAFEGPDHIQNGLSKREYFAGLAMQGILANIKYTQRIVDAVGGDRDELMALLSYRAIEHADALLTRMERDSE